MAARYWRRQDQSAAASSKAAMLRRYATSVDIVDGCGLIASCQLESCWGRNDPLNWTLGRWKCAIRSLISPTVEESKAESVSAEDFDVEVTRSDESEKRMVIERNGAFRQAHSAEAEAGLERLKQAAREGGNLFDVMMDIVEHCSVGQVTQALFESGGKFRRNM